jgi:hypothetical protein
MIVKRKASSKPNKGKVMPVNPKTSNGPRLLSIGPRPMKPLKAGPADPPDSDARTRLTTIRRVNLSTMDSFLHLFCHHFRKINGRFKIFGKCAYGVVCRRTPRL